MSTSSSSTELALVREAFNRSPESAERQLMLIGKEHGDDALAVVTRELSPAEIFGLARVSDGTKSSITQVFVTPEQFREAFSLFGSQYGGGRFLSATARVRDESASYPWPNLGHDLLDFLYPFFMEGDEKHRREMVEGFLKHDLSMKSLCVICIDCKPRDFPEFFKADPDATRGEEGWQQLILYVRSVSGKAFEQIRGKALEYVDGKNEVRETAIGNYCSAIAKELIKEARRATGATEASPQKEDDAFGDIP